jgi:hypothetical protein
MASKINRNRVVVGLTVTDLLAFPAAVAFGGAPCPAPGDGGPRPGRGAVMLRVSSPGT